nr:MAG TPA: hypothetical protein [Caudoviricetes sp.]
MNHYDYIKSIWLLIGIYPFQQFTTIPLYITI